jgi:putative two-component system hydrogenase maturation factor HypX/HoxX
VIAWRETAILRATVDGAVWIGTCSRREDRPATRSSCRQRRSLPQRWRRARSTARRLLPLLPADLAGHRYEEAGRVGFLHFDFYNGAMSTRQCQRLQRRLRLGTAAADAKVLVLMGGPRLLVERHPPQPVSKRPNHRPTSPGPTSTPSTISPRRSSVQRQPAHDRRACRAIAAPAAASWRCAADLVWARAGVILNPHYRNMGNLYGSEYWTYLLPARVGVAGAQAIMHHRLPMTAAAAVAAGLIDACLAGDPDAFRVDVARRAAELAMAPDLDERLRAKRARRLADELRRSRWRAIVRRNSPNCSATSTASIPSYHVARFHFVHKTPHSWTPRHLAIHRDLGWSVPLNDRQVETSALPTVLVVDDELRSQEALRRTLEEDFEVFTAASAEQAQRIMETRVGDRSSSATSACRKRPASSFSRTFAVSGRIPCASSCPVTPMPRTSLPGSTRPASTSI